MSKKQYGILFLWVMVTGFVGGAVSSQLFTDGSVFAKKAPGYEKVVRAEKFELVNRDGRVIGMLGYWGDIGPGLFLNQKEIEPGNPGVALSIDRRGWGGLSLYAKWKDRSYTAGIDPMAVQISVTDSKGNSEIATLQVDYTGNTGLFLFDKDFNARVALGSIKLKDARTGVITNLPISSLVLFDERGKVLWRVP